MRLIVALAVIVVSSVAIARSSAAPRSVSACSQAKALIGGAPSRSLLSILGVLRRPAMATDELPASLRRFLSTSFKFFGVEVFVDYVRRARVIAGTAYYVMPVLDSGCGMGALPGGGPQRMELWAGSGGGGAGNAATIEQATGYGTLGSFGHTTIEMLVPDGVASVTLHYPAGKIGGFDRHHAPAFTTTTTVVGNLMVVTVPRGGNRLNAPMTMTWRGPAGTIVRTFNRL